jgi:hypothetical protein
MAVVSHDDAVLKETHFTGVGVSIVRILNELAERYRMATHEAFAKFAQQCRVHCEAENAA